MLYNIGSHFKPQDIVSSVIFILNISKYPSKYLKRGSISIGLLLSVYKLS